MQSYKMWIGGKWVDAESGRTTAVINPATEEEIARIPSGDKADIDKAVASAKQAFPVWSGMTQAERSRIVNQISLEVKEHIEELARLDVLDHGTPIKLGRMWAQAAAHTLEYASQASRALMGDLIPVRPNSLYCIQREPIGVCALIIPWNTPIVMVASKLGAALATGNTCIIKPSNIDSLTTLKLAEILDKLSLPPGIINIVTGSGSTAGEAIASHPGIDMISFTGSSETGKSLMANASRTVKRIHMELGGKNPFIVLEDADIDAAISQAVLSSFNNSGMVCASPGRYYIHEKIYEEFVEKFIAGARKVTVGDPGDEKTDMGPVVSVEHRDRVEGYIKSGIEEGAKLLLGGQRPTTPPLDKGYYVMPTVFADVAQNMRIAREEIFGPVACLMNFSSEEKVIEAANDNIYGLCASVWTGDIPKGLRMVNRINAAAVGVNSHRFVSAETPWGGFKESGFGKENSIYGLEEYTQLKLITVDLDVFKRVI